MGKRGIEGRKGVMVRGGLKGSCIPSHKHYWLSPLLLCEGGGGGGGKQGGKREERERVEGKRGEKGRGKVHNLPLYSLPSPSYLPSNPPTPAPPKTPKR